MSARRTPRHVAKRPPKGKLPLLAFPAETRTLFLPRSERCVGALPHGPQEEPVMDDTNGTKEKKYSWSYKDGKMNCCESETSTCNVSKLWEVAALSTMHDAALQKATKEINALLDGVRRTNRDSSRELHFVQIEDRHLLAWVHSDLVGPLNDDRVITKMLRLKTNSAKPATPRKTAPARRKGRAA
jgi:hypothetical protein